MTDRAATLINETPIAKTFAKAAARIFLRRWVAKDDILSKLPAVNGLQFGSMLFSTVLCTLWVNNIIITE